MRTFSKIVVLTFTLSLLLSSSLYVHSVNELALAQSVKGFSSLTYLPVSPESEQLSLIPLLPGGPSPRQAHTAIKDELKNDMIIFGGAYFDIEEGHLYRYNDVWRLDLDSYSWTQVSTSGSPPPPVGGHTSIYDPVEHRMLVFGGGIDGGILTGVYELDLDSYIWSLLSTTGEVPTARWDHCAVYNSQNHSMVIFGGRDLGGALDDLWMLYLHTSAGLVWQRIKSYGPSERMGQRAIYVPDRNSMLVFGGSNYWVEPWPYFHYNDLWEFNFDTQTWSQLFPATKVLPPARDANLACYDGMNNRMLIFGGIGDYDVILNDLWELDLTTLSWRRSFPHLARDRFAGIFDETTQELIFFGGDFHGHYYTFGDGFRITTSTTPPVFKNGDVNCDGEINTADIVYLINYLFAGGPEPGPIR